MQRIRIQMNDIHESVPVKDGYYLLVTIDSPEKLVPSELCGGSFYKLEGLPGGVATGMVDMPEIYNKNDILAWGKIPEDFYY